MTASRRAFAVAGVVSAVLLGGSQGATADKLRVVATFSVIGDMVTNVAGDHVELTTLVGADGDTELYQPTLADGRTVAQARILFMNGLNDEFEPWLEPLLKQVQFAGTKVVVSRGAKTLTASEERAPTGTPMPAAIDQHAWLDPNNGVIYVRNIADALARADPTNAADYKTRAAAYVKELQAVDAWAKAEMAAVPAAKRRMLSSHDAFEYFGHALGITISRSMDGPTRASRRPQSLRAWQIRSGANACTRSFSTASPIPARCSGSPRRQAR